MPTIPSSPYEPLHDTILCELLARRESNVLLPGESELSTIYGFFVTKKGPGYTTEQGTFIKTPENISIGDEIIINGANGYKFQHPRTGERKFVILRAKDILAVVGPEKPMDETTKMQILGPAQ